MLSEQIIILLKKQSDLVSKLNIIDSSEEIRVPSEVISQVDKIRKEIEANHALLLKVGVIDHAYFNNREFEKAILRIKNIKAQFTTNEKGAQIKTVEKTEGLENQIIIEAENFEAQINRLKIYLLEVQEDIARNN